MRSIDQHNIVMMSEDFEEEEQSGVGVAEENVVERPRLYKVLLHNDDYTTMEFVVYILQKYFKKNSEQAHAIMLDVHTNGTGVCGVYTFEIAETKVEKVKREAKENGHPLMCSCEPE